MDRTIIIMLMSIIIIIIIQLTVALITSCSYTHPASLSHLYSQIFSVIRSEGSCSRMMKCVGAGVWAVECSVCDLRHSHGSPCWCWSTDPPRCYRSVPRPGSAAGLGSQCDCPHSPFCSRWNLCRKIKECVLKHIYIFSPLHTAPPALYTSTESYLR